MIGPPLTADGLRPRVHLHRFSSNNVLNLCGRLGMALAGDAMVTDRLSVAWRYLEVPPGYA
jgi:hypothetical protein